MVPPAGVAGVRDAVSAAKAGEPLAPVTVVPPSAQGGASLRVALARGSGLLNVVCRSLAEVAAALSARRAAPAARLLPRAVRLRSVAAVVGSHRATVRAYDAAFRELRRCSPSALAALDDAGEAADGMARFRSFRSLVEAWDDDVDVLLRAAGAAGAADAADAAGVVGHVVLYQPPPLSWAEQQLVDALAAAGRLTVVGAGGLAAAPAPVAPRIEPTKVIVAPDPEAEVRLAVGEVARLVAGGLRPHRVALVHAGDDEPYRRLVCELLDAAGVPWAGRGVGTLAASPPGRVLLGLLRLPAEGWSRPAVMGVLSDAVDVPPATLARWEAAARRAHVVGGVDGWRPRLERLAAEWPAVAADAGALAAEVDALLAVANNPPAATWSGLVAWTSRLLARWAPPSSGEVEAAVAQLAQLDGVVAPPTVASFVDAVAAQLEDDAAACAGPAPVVDGAVLVGSVADMVGADVDAVVLVGATEGRLPARHADDPLLPDRVRALTGGELPTRRERRHRELHLVSSLLAPAHERVLCAARADQRAQREQLPSRWLARAGEQCERLDVPSFAAAVLTTGPAACDQQGALQALGRGEPPASFGIERGVAAMAARASSAVTEWSGAVGPHPALAARARRSTAAAFEQWATCPFQHFLRVVLRVHQTRPPDDRAGLDTMTRGALVHAVLAALDRARVEGRVPSVEDVTRDVCAQLEASGRTARRLAWLLEQRTLAANLAAVTALDDAERGASGSRTVAADVTFDGAVVGGVRFGGHVDRVDAKADGSRRVVDYRTGRSDRGRARPDADPTAAGTRLQLLVAALAEGATEAERWYVTDAARGYPRVGIQVDGEVAARVARVVELIASGIEAGAFPASPGEAVLDTWASCRRCPYDRVCPSDRGDVAERTRSDPAVARLQALQVAG
jgi:ATP-dependent helicase/nuclease subunit B